MTKTTNKTILIIEDDPDISELLKIVIESEGYRVKAISENSKLEASLKKEDPSLIIMDLWISGSDNASVVKDLKKKKETSNIPLILISAKNSLEKIAHQTKADGFLSKPFNVKDLVQMVKRFA